MKRLFQYLSLAFALLCAAHLSAQSTVTVSANAKTIFGGNSATRVQVCFSLILSDGQQPADPHVAGTGVLVPTQTQCLSPDVNGLISTTMYANDAITVAGVTNTTVYSVSWLYNGSFSHGALYSFLVADGTEDLNSKTPINLSPSVTVSPTDSIYARLDGGNQPFLAAISACKVNGVFIAGSSCYSTAQLAITAACTSSPAGGSVYLPSGSFAQNSSFTVCSGLNILGAGSAQGDSVTCPTTITTTLSSGALFDLTNINDFHLRDVCITKTGTTGTSIAVLRQSSQRTGLTNVYISGPFFNPLAWKSSSSANASTIWNQDSNVHTTGTGANGIGCLFDSSDASAKVINGNFLFNVRCTGGASGVGIKLTNSGVHNQVINENQIWASEAVASGGTAIQIDQGSTRGIVFHDVDAEGSVTGFNKATTNTVTFVGGNISANSGTNVSDSQAGFTQFFGTNVGGIVQNFAVTTIGGVYVDGLSVGGAAPVTNQITGTTGWQIAASGAAVATVNNTSLEMVKDLIFDSGKKITQYDGLATAGYGVSAIKAVTSQKTENGADTNVLTFTPQAGPGRYRVSFTLDLSAANAATLGWTVSWEGAAGIVKTPTNLSLRQVGVAAPALTFTTSTTDTFYGDIDLDVDSTATPIVVKLTFSGTSFTGKASASIQRIM